MLMCESSVNLSTRSSHVKFWFYIYEGFDLNRIILANFITCMSKCFWPSLIKSFIFFPGKLSFENVYYVSFYNLYEFLSEMINKSQKDRCQNASNNVWSNTIFLIKFDYSYFIHLWERGRLTILRYQLMTFLLFPQIGTIRTNLSKVGVRKLLVLIKTLNKSICYQQ